MKMSKVLEAIREELKNPLPEPRVVSLSKKEQAKMAKKAKRAVEDDEELDEEEGDAEAEEAEEENPKSKKKAKKKAKSKGDDEDDSGYVTIQDLAEEAGIEAQSARVKLRESDLDKPEGGRWRWKDGSKDLKSVRKVLGL